jgi:hypothetical protein
MGRAATNRALRLKELLDDGEEHCTYDLWRPLGTAPMRAKNELLKLCTDVVTVGFHRHGEANYAVYRLRPKAAPQPTIRLEVPKQGQLLTVRPKLTH